MAQLLQHISVIARGIWRESSEWTQLNLTDLVNSPKKVFTTGYDGK